MRAAVFRGRGDVRVEDVPVPAPGPGELLLEVHAAGICGTDAAEYAAGPQMFPIEVAHPVTGHVGPMIPGHEFGGRVVGLGEGVRGFAQGALVASGAGWSCGHCWQCRRGRTNLCARYATVGLHRNGALAQFTTVPAAACLSVEPYGLDDDAAALAQPMAIAVHALRRGRPEAAEQVLLIGAGGIGAFLTFAAVQHGGQVTVADLDPERLAIAAALGAQRTLQVMPEGPGLSEQLADLGVVPAVVYEVSGSAAGLEAALAILPHGGRLVLVGMQKAPREFVLRQLTLTELELIGTNALVFASDLPESLRLLAARPEGWGDVAPVALPLDELVDGGLEPLGQGRSPRIKTLIDPWTRAARPTAARQREDQPA